MISVCIATYNGGKYIEEQLLSILKQLDVEDEVIISDDNSSDNTINIIRGLNDNRIKIFNNKIENKGYSKNFENAIKLSSGDYIFLSDQDDVWEINKIAKTLEKLSKYDFVVSDAKFVDEYLLPLNTTFFELRGGRRGFWRNLYRSQYLGACMAFKSSMLKMLLPFPKRSELCPHDLWISLVGEFFYKSIIINDQLIKYRRHESNVSTGGSNSTNTIFRKIWFRLYCVFQVFLRFFK